ncbi:MAG: hypothetical protein ACOYOT_04605 [Bacteroidales bacterium]
MTPSPKYLFKTLLLFSLLLSFFGCKVALLPPYEAQMVQQIEETAKSVDKFYMIMLEASAEANDTRAYEKYVPQYVAIEVELRALLNKNRVRPLNQHSTRICEITLQLWQKYKAEHKKEKALGNGEIRLNQKTFNDLFYAMQVAEKGKDIAN